jgi:hypothetical protein
MMGRPHGPECNQNFHHVYENEVSKILYMCKQELFIYIDRLCGLMVRVLGYRSRGPGSSLGTTKKKVMGLERGPLSLVTTTEELLDRKGAAHV